MTPRTLPLSRGKAALILLGCLGMVGLIFLFGWIEAKAQEQCRKDHGQWTVVGHHTVVTGKTITSQPTYGCVK
jgi:hypothetical protein